MKYVQFFQRSCMSDDIIPAIGDRAVVILDGRESQIAHNAISAHECCTRGFCAWQIFIGESFTRSSPITPITHID